MPSEGKANIGQILTFRGCEYYAVVSLLCLLLIYAKFDTINLNKIAENV